MAGWISSKLKVAETFLQQIDQQAAESLGKNEWPRREGESVGSPLARTESIPLKDQLKKKSLNGNAAAQGNQHLERQWKRSESTEKPGPSTPKSDGSTSAALAAAADRDWTELLGSPDPIAAVGSRPKRNQKKHGILVSGPRKVEKSAVKVGARLDASVDRKAGFVSSDGEKKSSNEELGLMGSSDLSVSVGRKSLPESRVSGDSNVVVESTADANGDGASLATSENGVQPHSGYASRGKDGILHAASSGVVDGVNLKAELLGNNLVKRDGPDVSVGHPVRNDLPGSSSGSDERSDSDSDSGSSSNSEDETRRREERRKRREQILAEEAAAKANEAIKEWENIVARLEGEKQSLEKILEERERQQAQEASELQMSMTETMEAVELEKQKHNSTRMEAFARLAKLETTNCELAKLLATTQRNLEVEVNHVAELKRQIELKEVANEELKRSMSNIHESTSLNEKRASKGVEFERGILEAEYSVVCDKVGQLQEKAKHLEDDIEMLRKEIEEPTEVEIELKKRLARLTDHLIKKQAQVESMTSEKATLLFRLETVSRLLDESKSSPQLVDLADTSDIESGAWSPGNARHRPLLQHRFRSGGKHLGSIIEQLDAIFSAGAVFLRRNPTAQVWAVAYLVCLHLWVLYILMSHSQSSDEAWSGAVISLQSINKTLGI